jgi:colanic acid/amylovoran biosynthesis glycosyltransferase
MLIYIFTEKYPCQYKPYFDTQIVKFLKDGHTLKIFSFGSQAGELVDKVHEYNLFDLTSHMPATLKSIPGYLHKIFWCFLRNPVRRITSAMKAKRSGARLKQYVMQQVRMVVLPVKEPDLCLVHNLTAAVHCSFLDALYPGARIAFYYHGGELPGTPTIGISDSLRAFSYPDYVFTNTHSSRDHAISRGCSKEKIIITPVGFDMGEYPVNQSRRYRRSGILRLLTVGRMSKEKGHIHALGAIRRLIDSGVENIHYKLIGDGPESESISEYIRHYSLEDFVEWLGYVDRTRLHKELNAADVHLLPSIALGTWQENQACVVQEAMLHGTLVISSDTGGVMESTAPSMREYCCTPGSDQDIACKIRKIMSLGEDEMRRLGDQCRRFATGNYDIREVNKDILNAGLSPSQEGINGARKIKSHSLNVNL